MSVPSSHCESTATTRRRCRTALGYRRFNCRSCRPRFNERIGTPFNDLHCPTDIALLTVMWRLRYKLSFRDVAELLLQRGYEVTHETIREWEFRFAPLLADQLRTRRRGRAGKSWCVDETYVKVSGRWCYLYRAIDRDGQLIDSMLNQRRDKDAARRFLRQHPTYRRAIRWNLGRKVLHRTNQCLNNCTEQSCRRAKPRYYSMLGFTSFEASSRFRVTVDELRQYFRVRRRGDAHVSLAEQRRLFLGCWHLLVSEVAAV